MGFEIARQFGLEGARLSILEYNSGLLAEAREKFKQDGVEVTLYLADVSKRDEVEQAVDAVGEVDIDRTAGLKQGGRSRSLAAMGMTGRVDRAMIGLDFDDAAAGCPLLGRDDEFAA